MLMIPPNFLRQEDKAVEFLSGIFQMLGPIGVLIGGFAAGSLSVSAKCAPIHAIGSTFSLIATVTLQS